MPNYLTCKQWVIVKKNKTKPTFVCCRFKIDKIRKTTYGISVEFRKVLYKLLSTFETNKAFIALFINYLSITAYETAFTLFSVFRCIITHISTVCQNVSVTGKDKRT